MKKSHFLAFILFLAINGYSAGTQQANQKLTKEQAWSLLDKYQDESFIKVHPKNLLSTSVYIDLAKEGWTMGEIIRLTDEYLAANKAGFKKDGLNIDYAKVWRPYFVSSTLMDATISEYTNPDI